MADQTSIENITPAQQKALSALLTEVSIRKAAEAAGVKDRTIYHWLKQPLFAAEYQSARREATRQAVARLQQSSGKAAERLEHLLTHGTQPVQLGPRGRSWSLRSGRSSWTTCAPSWRSCASWCARD
jgi:hypothetical protein